MFPLAAHLDLSGAWTTLWTAVQASAGKQLTTTLTVIGLIVLIAGIAGYIWGRMRKRGDLNGLVWAIVVGAMLSAPQVLFPIFLTIIDIICNLGIDLYNATAGG